MLVKTFEKNCLIYSRFQLVKSGLCMDTKYQLTKLTITPCKYYINKFVNNYYTVDLIFDSSTWKQKKYTFTLKIPINNYDLQLFLCFNYCFQ